MDVLQTQPWLTVVLVLGAVAYVVVKRLLGEPLNARDLCGPPLILTGIGVYQLTKVALTGADAAWLAGGVVVGLACGWVRGATIVLFTRNGVLWQRYTRKTFAVWVVSLLVSGGYALLALAGGMHHDARPVTLSIGIGMLGEMAALGLRALATGQPFSPDSKASPAARQMTNADLAAAARRFATSRHRT
jgi:hypothetical protein